MTRDAAEFDAFYSSAYRRVVGHVYAITGNRAEAEDAVADAFMKAWDRWGTVRETGSPEAWVRRVASNTAVSAWRKAVNRLRAHRRETLTQEVEAVGPEHVALVQALRRITEEQRRAIVLHHLVGLSVEEIAEETKAPTGTVKARLARGRRALAELLSEPTPTQLAAGEL